MVKLFYMESEVFSHIELCWRHVEFTFTLVSIAFVSGNQCSYIKRQHIFVEMKIQTHQKTSRGTGKTYNYFIELAVRGTRITHIEELWLLLEVRNMAVVSSWYAFHSFILMPCRKDINDGLPFGKLPQEKCVWVQVLRKLNFFIWWNLCLFLCWSRWNWMMEKGMVWLDAAFPV